MDVSRALRGLRASQYFGVPGIRKWFDVTDIAGLREAGMPEE
jgi:hypothetical protein